MAWNELDFSKLNEKEYTIVKLIAQGKSFQEISIITGMKPNTVRRYRENAINKLGLKGTVHPSVFLSVGLALEKKKNSNV